MLAVIRKESSPKTNTDWHDLWCSRPSKLDHQPVCAAECQSVDRQFVDVDDWTTKMDPGFESTVQIPDLDVRRFAVVLFVRHPHQDVGQCRYQSIHTVPYKNQMAVRKPSYHCLWPWITVRLAVEIAMLLRRDLTCWALLVCICAHWFHSTGPSDKHASTITSLANNSNRTKRIALLHWGFYIEASISFCSCGWIIQPV